MGTCESCLRRAFSLQIVGFQEIFVYQEYFCVSTLLASSSNHNDDAESMKIKQATVLIRKTKTLTVPSFYWQISFPLSYD